jgi:dynein heavy chain
MNTVLDDNKMLCMANSERIKFTNYMHMIFEVADLAVASPATVSRCGMVYIDPDDLGWMPYVKTWVGKGFQARFGQTYTDYLMELFAKYIQEGMSFASKKCAPAMLQVDSGKISTLCSLIDSYLTIGNVTFITCGI